MQRRASTTPAAPARADGLPGSPQGAAAGSTAVSAAAAAAEPGKDAPGPRLWRFGADTARVPRRAAEDPTWDITPELMAAFRQLAETMCPILTRALS